MDVIVEVLIAQKIKSPVVRILGVNTHMPEITGTHEQGNCLQVSLVDGPGFLVAFQERYPTNSNRLFEPATPEKYCQVVRPVTKTAAIEVKESQGAIRGDIGMVALQVTMATTLLQGLGRHRQDTLAKYFGITLEEAPIIRSLGEEWSYVN